MDSLAPAVQVLRFIVPLVYALTAAGYLSAFIRDTKSIYRRIQPALVLGITLHALLLVLFGVSEGRFPFATVFEGLFFCSLGVSVLYFSMERGLHEPSFGAFLWPVNFILSATSALLLDKGHALPRAMMTPYYVFHVAFFFMAYACFFFSFTVSVMYLLQHRQIRGHRLGPIFQRLPSLSAMDRAIMRCDALGLGLFLLGFVMGYVWLELVLGPTATRMGVKIGFAGLMGVVYLAEHILRIGKGWQGARTSMMSIAGFVTVVMTLLAGRHGF